MFKVHTKNGETFKLDLSDENQAKEWIEKFKDKDFQSIITGITVVKRCGGKLRCKCKNSCSQEHTCNTGVQFSVSRPNGIKDVFYQIEKINPSENNNGGERITCFVENMSLTMMSHNNQPASRIILSKLGKRGYNPFL